MSIFDDIGNQTNQIITVMQDLNIVTLVGLIGTLVIVALAIGLTFIAISRIIKKSREYVKPKDHMGTFKLIIRNDYPVVGNVNKDKSMFMVEVFERMKRMPELADNKDGIASLERLWSDGVLHPYDMRVFDSMFESDKLELPNNDIIILSPVPLDSANISWEDLKGERSFTGSATDLFMRYPKNVLCSEYTEYFDVDDVHGNKKRVYILAPYSSTVNEQLQYDGVKFIRSELKGKEAFINVVNLPNKRELATMAAVISSLNDTYMEVERNAAEIKTLKDRISKLHKLTEDQHKEIEGHKARLKTHPLYGEEKPLIPIQPNNLIALVLVGLIGGFGAAKLAMIDLFAPYQGMDIMLLIAAAVIIICAVKFFEKKQKDQDQFKYNEVGDVR